MKSQLSNGTIFHHEITFMLLYCSVLSWGNSLCSVLGGLMACSRAKHFLWLTKIILNIRTHITSLSLLSILPLHLLPFVVALIFLKVLWWRCGFLLIASYSVFLSSWPLKGGPPTEHGNCTIWLRKGKDFWSLTENAEAIKPIKTKEPTQIKVKLWT